MPEEPYNPPPIGNPSVLARRNWWQTALVKFIGKYTPKCREMVRILSQSMDEPMPLMVRIKKRLHFLICCWCQRYEAQLRYVRETVRKFPDHADEASSVEFSPEARDRIKQKLAENARGAR
jgi:hypothetical protein